jgi:hydroxypyruvate reductase
MSDEAAPNGAIEAARETVHRLFAAALKAVDPALAVRHVLKLRDGALDVGGARIDVSGDIIMVAVGKAATAMTEGALAVLGPSVAGGHVITKEGHVDSAPPETIVVYEAGHPIPDARGVEATRALLDRLETLDAGVVVLALISGGGSALLEAPREGVSLDELALTTDLLLRAGAPIEALNAVRAPLSRVKSGGLRAAAPKASWVTLILSDVLGNDPRVIASGPTVSGAGNPAAALAIIEKYGVREQLPKAVLAALQNADPEHEPVADEHDVLLIIGDNAAAVQAATAEAERAGLKARVVWTAVEGEAAELGREFVGEAANAPDAIDVLLGGGEATVTVRGDGMGGRNTEFALAAALEMERRGLADWVVASLATDGQDALTGLAGAIADAGTCQRAREAGVDPDAALARNDSAAVFEAAGGAVHTGPTGTNVNDLYIAMRVSDSGAGHVERGG